MLINKNPRKGSGLPSNQPKNPNNEGMNNIFSMIGNQESQITSLLKKYGSEQV